VGIIGIHVDHHRQVGLTAGEQGQVFNGGTRGLGRDVHTLHMLIPHVGNRTAQRVVGSSGTSRCQREVLAASFPTAGSTLTAVDQKDGSDEEKSKEYGPLFHLYDPL